MNHAKSLWGIVLLVAVVMGVIAGLPTQTLADYSGALISVSADSPIILGNSLDYTVTVQNTGSDDWWYEWVARVDNTSWSVPWSYMDSYCYDYPSAGELSTDTFDLSASNLPSSVGNYSFNVSTYTWDDWGDGFWMSNIPMTVNFTINENTAPTADADGDYNVYPPGHPSRSSWTDGGKVYINDWWRNVGETEWYVTLDASGSTDDGNIISYAWDLNDDSVADVTVTTPTTDASKSFLEGLGWTDYDTRQISLMVTDDGSPALSDSDVANLTMIPEPATLSLLALGGLTMLRKR